MHMLQGFFLCLVVLVVTPMANASDSLMRSLPCEAETGFEYACGLNNPEDLVYFPPSNEILFSQLGDMYADNVSPLGALNPENMATRLLATHIPKGQQELWGAQTCEAINGINGHGLDLSQREDGRWQLLVVNHNLRESVEFYEVAVVDGRASLIWRGCVSGGEYSSFNDVVAQPNGGFFVSHVMPHLSTWAGKFGMLKMLFGLDTGRAMQWTPNGSLQPVPGSAASYANGINVAPDGQKMYLNAYGGNEVFEYDLSTGRQAQVLSVLHPDNSSWDSQDRLLITSQHGNLLESATCLSRQPNINCVVPFSVVAYDPSTAESETVFSHEASALPVATIALEVGDDLYLGTYSGDRIVKVLNYRTQPNQ